VTRRRTAIFLCAALTLAAGCSRHKVATTPRPLVATPAMIDSLWSEAMTQFAKKKWDKAAVLFERVALEMPLDDPRGRMKFMYVGEARLGEGSNLQAVREFRRLADQYPSDSLAPRALLRAGDAYAGLWRRVELDPTYGITALTTYQELLSRYPSSSAAKEGIAKVADLNNRFALKKYKDGVFYYKFKAYDSAILIFKYLVATWPESAVVPDALGKLIDTYRHLGYNDDVRDLCAHIRQYYASNAKLVATCPANAPAAPAAAKGGSGR
jgi:outer membrane protein assembly factor BamD